MTSSILSDSTEFEFRIASLSMDDSCGEQISRINPPCSMKFANAIGVIANNALEKYPAARSYVTALLSIGEKNSSSKLLSLVE